MQKSFLLLKKLKNAQLWKNQIFNLKFQLWEISYQWTVSISLYLLMYIDTKFTLPELK